MKLTKIPLSVLIVFLLVWQFLLIFQGLDLADTGFHLSSFRFIFDDPYSVQYSMMYWLSEVCGHFWMSLLSGGGLLWARIGSVFFVSFSFFTYYQLLRKLIGDRNSVIGLGVTLIFILLGGPECLNYDIFTTFGFAIGVLALFQGLVKSNPFLMFLSGFVFGISVFFKLSNLSALLFVLAIPVWHFLNNKNWKNLLVHLASWFTGLVAGMALILLFIRISGQWELFFDNLKFISSMGNDAQSSHGLKPMLISYLKGYFNAFVMVILFMALLWFVLKTIGKRITHVSASVILVGSFAIILTAFFGDVFWSKIRYLFLGLMIIHGIVLLVNRKAGRELRLLAMLGLILMFVAPLGSDSGLDKSIWGMWILGPLLLTLPEGKTFSGSNYLAQPQLLFVKTILGVLVLSTAIVHAWQTPYFDAGSRFDKIATINNPDLKLIYTSPKRAKVIEELVQNGFPNISNEKYLLSFIEIPMVNYLSDKAPFISTSWPKLYYNPEKFRLKLEEAQQIRKEFPAIIRQKQNTMLNDWPRVGDDNYLNYPENLSKWPEHGKILNEFLTRNNYQVVWENEMFQILTKK